MLSKIGTQTGGDVAKKQQEKKSVAEELRLETEDILRRVRKKTGRAKMSWKDYEEIMKELLEVQYGMKLNRGFLLGLLLVQKTNGKFNVTIELDE